MERYVWLPVACCHHDEPNWDRLYQNLIGNKEWMEDLHDADAIFVASHSQGSVVSTHILDRLIADGHVRTALNADASAPASGVASGSVSAVRPPQRICCLALCGIHHGPLRYFSTSSLVQPYIQARFIRQHCGIHLSYSSITLSTSRPQPRESYLNTRCALETLYLLFSIQRVSSIVPERGKHPLPGIRKGSPKCTE